MTRLLTFGCSATNWYWPTWATILGRSYDQFENRAMIGLGNRAIAERVSEAIVSQKIGPTDTVIVQWTHFHRHDVHFPGIVTDSNWRCSGNIHTNPFELKWVLDGWNEQSYAMHSLNFIHMTKALLDSTGCRYYFTTIDHLEPEFERLESLSIYKDMWNSIDWIEPIYAHARNKGFTGTPMVRNLVDTVWRVMKRKNVIDPHPTPSYHLSWLEDNLVDKLGVTIDKEFANRSIEVFGLVGNDMDQAEFVYEREMNWRPYMDYVQGL